jgi:ElaB/YqjD/DUF883 family membrane-anchored ribosome-binding protein
MKQREESIMSTAEKNILSEESRETEERATNLEKEDSRFKAAAVRAVHSGKDVAQRWCKQGLTAAEGVAGYTADHIKHDPVRSAAISFAVGLSVGALVAWSIHHEPTAPAQVDTV